MALTPEERAKAEEAARIQTGSLVGTGMKFLKFQIKFIGVGCLLFVVLGCLAFCSAFH